MGIAEVLEEESTVGVGCCTAGGGLNNLGVHETEEARLDTKMGCPRGGGLCGAADNAPGNKVGML